LQSQELSENVEEEHDRGGAAPSYAYDCETLQSGGFQTGGFMDLFGSSEKFSGVRAEDDFRGLSLWNRVQDPSLWAFGIPRGARPVPPRVPGNLGVAGRTDSREFHREAFQQRSCDHELPDSAF